MVLLAATAAALLGCGGASKNGGEDETPAVVPCGGDLTGNWVEIAHGVKPPADFNTNLNACWNLMVSNSGGIYGATTRYPFPDGRSTIMRFSAEGQYTAAMTRAGMVTLDYAPECLTTDQGAPSCAELQAALGVSGLGEGAYFDTMCSDRSGGGCHCTVRVSEVGGPNGNWVANPGGKSITITKPEGYPEPREFSVGYCVEGDTLRFDGPLDGGSSPYASYTGNVTFTRENCTDTPQQLVAKYGDLCSNVCPPQTCGQTP